jgi:hypothetical protein
VDGQASALQGVLYYRTTGVAAARDMMWSSGVADRRDVERGDAFWLTPSPACRRVATLTRARA